MLMADAERKINQLYNDVNAIYGMLDAIKEHQGAHSKQLESLKSSVTTISATQMRHGNRLDELDVAVAGVSEQIKEMRVTQMRHENRFTEIDQRFDGVDQRFDGIDRRFDGVDQRFDGMDQKLDLIMKALNVSAN
jgi:archaellum component FlaC